MVAMDGASLKNSISLALCIALLPAAALAASPVPSNGVITSPGEYYLAGNKTVYSGTAIQINANDVDLNLGGWTVRCAPSYPATERTYGVSSSANHVTIRNGIIAGCFMGINASGPALAVLGVDLSTSTYIGINAGGVGTKISGCIFQSIGGYSLEAYAVGINSPGTNSVIERNTFRNIYRQASAPANLVGEGVGVLISAGQTGVVVRSNWMENGSPSDSIGIWTAVGSAAFLAENSITNFGDGAIRGGGTIQVTNNRLFMRWPMTGSRAIAGAGLVAVDNVIVGFEDAINGGATDGGGNFVY